MEIIKDIGELKEPARSACRAHLEECKSAGLDVFLTETYRTQARQDALYAQGRTKPGAVVTRTKNSRHTARTAWDICFTSTGYNDVSKFRKAGAIAKGLGIAWGGDWKTPDMPHFEFNGDLFMRDTETDTLVAKAKEKGVISDTALWKKYLTGAAAPSPANLKSLFRKITG